MNTLYYGDNLDILRRYVADSTIDLIYLDPPFNSNATYNVFLPERDGTQARVQLLTVSELLAGKGIDYPRQAVNQTWEKAPREKRRGKQGELGIG